MSKEDFKAKLQRIIRFKSSAEGSSWDDMFRMVSNKNGSSQLFCVLPDYLAITDENGDKFFKIPAVMTAFPLDYEAKTKANGKTKQDTTTQADPTDATPAF